MHCIYSFPHVIYFLMEHVSGMGYVTLITLHIQGLPNANRLESPCSINTYYYDCDL